MCVDAEGWYHTGDVGYADKDGYFYIVDRVKAFIKCNAYEVAPAELEALLVSHPAVAEAAVIAVPHPRWAERPLLIVTPCPDRRPDRDDLLAFLAERFPRWMIPDDVVVLDDLPHTATGKLMKTRLREMFREHKLPER